MADDDTNLIDSWDLFDKLKQLESASTPSTPEGAIVCEDHVCGPLCCFLIEDDNGSYVCPLSGMVFGQQTALGFSDHTYLQQSAAPAHTPRATPRRSYNSSRTELFSIAVQQICRLVKNVRREEYSEKKNASARKTAVKQLTAATTQLATAGGCLMRATESVYGVYERYGGGVITRRFSDRRINLIAETICSMYHKLWVPYAQVSDHRPTRQHFCLAALYIIAEGNFGRKLHDPLLSCYLPDIKSLSKFGIKVNQLTNSSRFIKEAIAFVQKGLK
jgi:hypothetical protein